MNFNSFWHVGLTKKIRGSREAASFWDRLRETYLVFHGIVYLIFASAWAYGSKAYYSIDSRTLGILDYLTLGLLFALQNLLYSIANSNIPLISILAIVLATVLDTVRWLASLALTIAVFPIVALTQIITNLFERLFDPGLVMNPVHAWEKNRVFTGKVYSFFMFLHGRPNRHLYQLSVLGLIDYLTAGILLNIANAFASLFINTDHMSSQSVTDLMLKGLAWIFNVVVVIIPALTFYGIRGLASLALTALALPFLAVAHLISIASEGRPKQRYQPEYEPSYNSGQASAPRNYYSNSSYSNIHNPSYSTYSNNDDRFNNRAQNQNGQTEARRQEERERARERARAEAERAQERERARERARAEAERAQERERAQQQARAAERERSRQNFRNATGTNSANPGAGVTNSPTPKTHFACLGITREQYQASKDCAKKAYLKLAKIFHPDKVKEKCAQEGREFNEEEAHKNWVPILSAYETLNDEAKAREYIEALNSEGQQQQYAQGQTNNSSHYVPPNGFDAFFRSFNRPQGSSNSRGPRYNSGFGFNM